MSFLNEHFANETVEQQGLIRQKGFYLYSYMANRKKFAEQKLPPLQHWSDVLIKGKVAVSEADLEQTRSFLECLIVRAWRIITTCISRVTHSFLLASLKSFVKLITKLMAWTVRTFLVLPT